MEKLNFYSYDNFELFSHEKITGICLLGACTARNIALGIEYFSNKQIRSYAPYETIFNLPSLLNDLEIVSKNLEHKIIINEETNVFSDKIRFWNQSQNIKDVVLENKRIDKGVIEGIKNSEVVIVALGSVEMWQYSNKVLNRLPKNKYFHSEVENVYLEVDEAKIMMNRIIRCIKKMNPNITIQFSIPYILLKASEKFSNLHLATTENYRILKTAIMDLGEEYYFPEYELFKFHIEKNNENFQLDNRHPSVKLISNVTKHIVSEIDKNYVKEWHNDKFIINKVNEKGIIYGKEIL